MCGRNTWGWPSTRGWWSCTGGCTVDVSGVDRFGFAGTTAAGDGDCVGMEGIWGVCGGVSWDAAESDASVGRRRFLVKKGATCMPCGDGGRELWAQQGQFVSVEISEAGGEKYHVLPSARRVRPPRRHLPSGCPATFCDVCEKKDEGSDGVKP